MPIKTIAPETLARLCKYHWPGNVRQLENAIEMAVALSGNNETLHPADFPLPPLSQSLRAPSGLAPHIPVPEEGLDFDRLVGSIELSLLEQALARTSGNKKLAADLLGLKRTTLAAKLKTLGASAAQSPAR
jgi:DNA-binding NtrC family response regulator